MTTTGRDRRPTAAPPSPLGPRLLRGAPVVGLAAHQAVWGPRVPARTGLVAEVERAGLGGRGGAGFPLAHKLRDVASRGGRTVVVNATEGEPASAKDVTLLTANPHLVLDGAETAAEAVGAHEIIVCVARAAAPGVVPALARALSERSSASAAIRIEQTPDRYLSGQETALVRWLDGGEAKPSMVPPRPSERGVGRRPTLVSNAETLAHLALVARFGAEWFRTTATASGGMASGTRLVTLSGAVERPGVYEVDHGAPLGSVVALAGGSVADSGGVLVGGYFGAWLPPSAAVLALADDALAPYGAGVGAGIVAVLPAGHCGLAETARILRWLAAQSAGQCGPCTHGLPAIAAAFDGLVAGHRRAAAEVERLAAMVEGRGACGLPDGSIRLVRSALRVFGPDAEAHTGRGPCRAQRAVLPVPAPGGWR